VLLSRSAYQEVVDALVLDGDGGPALAESRGLALLYLGRIDEADAAFRVAATRAGDDAQRARAHSLVGMAAQARDRLVDAAQAYEQALALARAAGDLHGAAIYAANLGATLREQAEYERALAPTEDAARELGWLGKRAERSGALFNLGNLLLSMGDLDGAAAAAEEALSLSQGAGREAGYALLLAGDLARRRGDPQAAVARCRAAAQAFANAGEREQLIALRNLAEALADAGRHREAKRALDEASRRAARAGLSELLALTRVRLPLDAGEPADASALAALASCAERAASQLRRDLAFRAQVTLARSHARAGRLREALAAIEHAANHWEEILMRTPELRRPSAGEDPDARRLRELQAAAVPADVPRANEAVRDDGPLKRLLSINKRLNSELRLPRLLELILDTVIELTSAERGFILLANATGQLEVSLARNIDQQTLAAGRESSFSRSIAERAAREAAPIVTLDAAGDERFEAALSVSHLKLRSVLAVPLQVKGRVVGCVYADHRLRAAAFGDADVQLVCDLAEQAAIAIENARLLEENERRGREVAELARELERKVQDQALELGELHREVRSSRAALAVRYNYDNLVGRTPRMLELFRLLDRVTETSLPVVIYGESGTGKELVARALHHNGPRRGKPFVSESCAAIPETLLEAALFGHVRGAFTGADSERRGLFEIAHCGTLFLDEVGEMTAAMQAKLLRVLQTGEFRRVGGERTLKVDVRLLVASNRDLGRLVEEGRFREDLFYRLNVVRVALPPLRERRDDVPLLVEHFLRKHAAETG
jgi:transcriptional regulator with GAF, ATPase, and Fis domain/Tfp pilus assembly protein PilF